MGNDYNERSILDDAEDFSYEPKGGPLKQWLAGMALPLVPICYGISCFFSGQSRLFSDKGITELSDKPAIALAVSYIALGSFIHFHYFWGLESKLCRFSQAGKVVSLLIFLPLFIYALIDTLHLSNWTS